jgi:hypothetical protein
VGWGFLKNMKHKQNNDSAVLEEKRIVFFMSIPESNGKEFSPEEALKNLRENVDTVDKKTIIKSLEALQNIPDLPPKIQQGLRDSAKNIDHMSAVDRAKFRQALERIQPFLEAAEKQHDFHKQNVISVLEKYAALLPSEVPVVEKWKKDISLTADDQKILDFAIKRMVGENTDGWAQLEIKKQNQSEKNRLELWFAIKSGMYLLGMEPEEIQKKLNKKMPEYTEENRENLSLTEKLSQAKHEFQFQNEDLREEADGYKQDLLIAAAKGDWKNIRDPRLMPMFAVLLQKNDAVMPEKVRGQAINVINQILGEGGDYSFRELNEKANSWNTKFRKMKEGKKGEQLGKIKNKPHEYKYLEQMAVYEFAVQAKEKMEEVGKFEHEIGQKIGGIQIIEGSGFELAADLDQYSEKDFKEAGNMAKRMLSPAGMATFYVMQYGGLMMALMNLIAFVQSKGENPQALAYTAMGFAAMKGGSEMTRSNAIDSFLNPEKKLYNDIAYLATKNRVDILQEYTINMDFYMQLDLSNRDQMRTILSKYRRTQKEKFNREVRDPAKEKKKGGHSVDIPKYTPGVRIADFLDGGPLENMLVDGANIGILKKLSEHDEDVDRQAVWYDAIKFLIDRKIGHGQLHSVQEISQQLPKGQSVAQQLVLSRNIS